MLQRETARQRIRPFHPQHHAVGQRPGPGHRHQVIPPTAQRQPRNLQPRQLPHHRRETLGGKLQVRQRIGVIAVDPHLRHQHIRRETPDQRQRHLPECVQIHLVPSIRIQRQIHRIPPPPPLTQLADKARSGKQIPPRFVHRNRQHPIIPKKGILHPVAMMGVHIYVGHPHPPAQEVMNRQRRIVEHAETRSMARRGVMQPARNVIGAIHYPVGHQLGRRQRSPAAQNRRIVHPGEIGITPLQTEVEAMGLADALPGAELPHRRDVLRRMQPAQFLLLRRPRRHQSGILVVKGPIAPQQFVGITQAHRAHRVAAAQFVARHPVIINKSGPGHIIPPAEKYRHKMPQESTGGNRGPRHPPPDAPNSAKFVSQNAAQSNAKRVY